MKRSVEKRLEILEARLLPKTRRPRLKIITRQVADELKRLNKDVDADMVMIMPRPGDRPEDAGQDTLTINVVDTPGSRARAKEHREIIPEVESEPDDVDLEGTIADLERRLKDGGGRP